MSDVVMQTNDRYAGPLVGGRYQVLASTVGTTFYAYDHGRGDIVRDDGKGIRRFGEIIEALAFLGFTSSEGGDSKMTSAATFAADTEENEMARPVKVSEAQAKAAASMEKRVAAKRAAANDKAPKVAAKVAPKAQAKVSAPKAVEATAPAKGRGQAAMFRQMIAEGKLDDKAMIAAVRAAFPDKKVLDASVSYYRARMS